MSRIQRNADHKHRDERRRADDDASTWDSEGGAREHRVGDSDEDGRTGRWTEANAEHWHSGGYSEQTRERSEEE
jgi:hypothetical protein